MSTEDHSMGITISHALYLQGLGELLEQGRDYAGIDEARNQSLQRINERQQSRSASSVFIQALLLVKEQ